MFQRALADDALTVAVKTVIRTGLALVREGRDQMRDLEHTLAIAA